MKTLILAVALFNALSAQAQQGKAVVFIRGKMPTWDLFLTLGRVTEAQIDAVCKGGINPLELTKCLRREMESAHGGEAFSVTNGVQAARVADHGRSGHKIRMVPRATWAVIKAPVASVLDVVFMPVGAVTGGMGCLPVAAFKQTIGAIPDMLEGMDYGGNLKKACFVDPRTRFPAAAVTYTLEGFTTPTSHFRFKERDSVRYFESETEILRIDAKAEMPVVEEK